MRCGRRALITAALCGVLTVGACGKPEPPPAAASTGWRELTGSPLSPRLGALGVWTGREVLLIGGSDAKPCPPAASCAAGPPPLTDGAAVDPATNRWRRIAAPPAPVSQGVVVGSVVYALGDTGFFAYDVDRDTWKRLAMPFGSRPGHQLLAAGDRVVAYRPTDEAGPGRDYVLDPRTATWSALPADPLGAAFDRSMVWTGREVVLFDHELVPNPGAEKPAVTRAAVFDLDDRRWRHLPDAPMLSTGPWLAVGDRLVNPTLGGADGGEVNGWGRTYPYGGSVALAAGNWSPLPEAPGGSEFAAGARTATSAVYLGPSGLVLDTTTGSWQPVPAIPGGGVSGRTVVTAGVRMVVFGGARFQGSEGTLLNKTWIWTP